ncbi:MAG: hypothetical protein CR978_01375 [Gammaproteobacteria bacterium]|nr:MAG: hypothetical protein CR978_01375 [Gammaproteobacteria bacterium]
MQTDDSLDATLESVSPLFSSKNSDTGLSLRIVYHPDVSRIGECAFFTSEQSSFSICRSLPVFSKALSGELCSALDDPYISRTPLRVDLKKDRVCFSSAAKNAKVLINQHELCGKSLCVSNAELEHGIVIFLAKRIVLLLRNDVMRETKVLDPGLLIGSSTVMCELRDKLYQIARAGTDLLIRGASGTGKELVARTLHAMSDRANQPFIAVNMSAIPAELGAVELFGCEKGAFTGADSPRMGYFSEADGGTLFLDEIGDTPCHLQPQLLRVIQEREIQVVGGGIKKVKLCVVSATDRNLQSSELGFSGPLHYRLGSTELFLPTLDERREDLGELAMHLVQRHRGDLSPEVNMPGECDDPRQQNSWAYLFYRMTMRSWHGNVRELENRIRQLMLSNLYDSAFLQRGTEAKSAVNSGEVRRVLQDPVSLTAQDISQAMREAGWEIAAAARKLGVTRQFLYRRIHNTDELRLVGDIPAEELVQCLREHDGVVDLCAAALRVSRVALERRLRDSNLQWQ